MNTNLDLLIEASVVQGQLAAGLSPKLVSSRTYLGAGGVAILANSRGRPFRAGKSPKWSETEDKFLKSYLGFLSEDEIAEALGRTPIAVHLRWKRELALPAPSKHPDYITCNQIANGLCVDVHSVMRLIDRGILNGFMLPSVRSIRLVHRITLLRFLINPMNWVYFNPDKVGNIPPTRRRGKKYDSVFWSYARRLVMKKKTLWDDEWWSIGRVARYHGITDDAIRRAIYKGKLPATDWGNYWILKSHATNILIKLQSWTGKGGSDQYRILISSAAEAFLVLSEAIGLIHSDIAAMMKWKERRVIYLLRLFRQRGWCQRIIKENNLKVFLDSKTGETFASYKIYRNRFPRLVRLMKSFKSRAVTRVESRYINRVKHKIDIFEEATAAA